MTDTQNASAAEAPFDVNEIFDRLRELKARIRRKGGKHDSATVMIAASIDEGFNTGPRIIGTLARLGFNRQHAGMMLENGLGNDSATHHWRRDENGIYHNLPGALTISAASLDVSHLLKGEAVSS